MYEPGKSISYSTSNLHCVEWPINLYLDTLDCLWTAGVGTCCGDTPPVDKVCFCDVPLASSSGSDIPCIIPNITLIIFVRYTTNFMKNWLFCLTGRFLLFRGVLRNIHYVTGHLISGFMGWFDRPLSIFYRGVLRNIHYVTGLNPPSPRTFGPTWGPFGPL